MKTLLKNKKSSAFTLIEILAVIVVLAVLAVLLYPLIQRAMEMARTTTCLSNQHIIGVKLLAYLPDHNYTFPQLVSYTPTNLPGKQPTLSDLESSLDQTAYDYQTSGKYCYWNCPTAGLAINTENMPYVLGLYYHSNYCFNARITYYNPPPSAAGCNHLSRLPFMNDIKVNPLSSWFSGYSYSNYLDPKDPDCCLGYYHLGHAHILFADGHSESFTLQTTPSPPFNIAP